MSRAEMTFLNCGIAGLNQVLGGGLPEGDLILAVGRAGSGKTTLAFQMGFHLATTGHPVVYVSTLSEPASRLLRHLRTYDFYDERQLGKTLFLESIYPLLKRGIGPVMDALLLSIQKNQAHLLILDGLSSLRDLHPDSMSVRTFVYELGLMAAPLGCTVLLTSASLPDFKTHSSPEFTMCDCIIELIQRDEGEQALRRVRAWKVRGAAHLLGEHTLRISTAGLAVHPRPETLPPPALPAVSAERVTTGQPELDAMIGGGFPRGSVTIVGGAPGTGKTLLALQYVLEGARVGQPGVLVGFRESQPQLIEKARGFGWDLEGPLRSGLVTIQRHVPLELEPDEILTEAWETVVRTGAIRLAVDSFAELERAIPNAQRRYRFMAALGERFRSRGVTSLLLQEVSQVVGPELDFTHSPLDVLAENVILLRYVEYESDLRRIISVLKMRDTSHDHSIRQYEIEESRFRILSAAETVQGLLSGIARLSSERRVKRENPDEPHEGPG